MMENVTCLVWPIVGINHLGMGNLKRAVVGFLIASTASSVLGFESRTLTYDVPNKASYPPLFPPAPADYTPLGTWDTVEFTNGLGITTPGLQVPKLDDVFAAFSVPVALQGALARIDISVSGFAYVSYQVDNDGVSAISIGSMLLDSELVVYAPVNSAPASFPLTVPDLTVVLNQSVPISLSADDGDTAFPTLDVGGTDYASGDAQVSSSGSKSYVSGDGPFAFFSGSGVVYIPIGFNGNSLVTGSGNVSFTGDTFGAALVSVTYTFVPESDLAWVGLPLVVGGWWIRRRMVAAKQA